MAVWEVVYSGGLACSHFNLLHQTVNVDIITHVFTILLKERMVMSCLKTSISH